MSRDSRKYPLPGFGRYLASLRFRTNMTQKEVAERLKKRGVRSSQSLVGQYELGMIASPPPNLLRGLAEMYGEPYQDMVVRLVKEKYGVDLQEAEKASESEQQKTPQEAVVRIRLSGSTISVTLTRIEDVQKILSTIKSLLPKLE